MMTPKQFFQEEDTAASIDRLPQRAEMDSEFQWRLEDIFADDHAWEAAFRELEKQFPKLASFRGKLGTSADSLRDCLQLQNEAEEKYYRLYIYAGLKNDQDTGISQYQSFRDRVSSLGVKIGQAAAFIKPEILAIPEETIAAFLEQNTALGSYRHALEDLLRSKEHVLPAEQEQLLAMTGEIAQSPYHIFSMFNNADIKFPTIVDEDGVTKELTKGRYNRLMESHDRRVRQEAFFAMYETYGKWTNTLAATLSAAVKRDVFYARARKYTNALEAALDSGNIPAAVYDNVVNTINQNLAPMHRYMALRKRMLGLEELHPWDLSVPLLSDVKFDIPYPEARATIREALHPLGSSYQQVLEGSFSRGWIDVYENQGKRSGAYSWSTFGVHPYILLNYQDTLDDMFTLAHELGHALHSHYTNATQPFHYSNYTIFVAEVASTFNEALLMDHLLKHTSDKERKLYLLNNYIDQIRGTVYMQALFAEFEKSIHEKAENGEALTAELLNGIARDLYQRYYGPQFLMDREYDINWCRIPHFYYNFYVYKYVTGFSAATALSQQVLAGNTAARDAYLHFLSRGSSDYSINLLKDAGVDMASPEPLLATTRLMEQLLDEMENLLQAG